MPHKSCIKYCLCIRYYKTFRLAEILGLCVTHRFDENRKSVDIEKAFFKKKLKIP